MREHASEIAVRDGTRGIVGGESRALEALAEDGVAGPEAEGVVRLGEEFALELGCVSMIW